MRGNDFERLLGFLDELSAEQKRRLQNALGDGDSEASVLALLESRLGDEPGCHYCDAGHEALQRWGKSHGLQRWRCCCCERSFNALTGTPLARLRKRARWLVFAEALSERLTVKQAAKRCGVDPTTSFRWRHRFLRAEVANKEALAGIIEADETFFRLSFKGSRRWQKPARWPPRRPPKKRGTKANLSGMSVEQVPVLVARDRSGNSRTVVLAYRTAQDVDEAIGDALPKDAILCSDGFRGFAYTANKRGIRHEAVAARPGKRVRDGIWHIQNANAHHSRLKAWTRSFNGIATRYLPNYLAWHHMIEKNAINNDPQIWIKTALNG